jgi:glycosyltransferase involved in cell wall biosynthesis
MDTKYKILILGIDIFTANAGLSLYTKTFLDMYPEKVVCINIIASTFEDHKVYPKIYNNNLVYDFYVNNYNIIDGNAQIGDCITFILDIHPELKCIIYPDFIFAKHINFKKLQEENYILIMFIHMLYKGGLNHYIDNNKYLLFDALNFLLATWLENTFIKNSPNIICNSYFTQRSLLKYYPNYKGSVISIPLGVNKSIIPFSPQLETDNVIFFGRLHPQKGIDYIFHDIDANKDYYKNNPITICSGLAFKEYLDKIKIYDDCIKYLGDVNNNDLIELLKSYKYCIFPSIYEPYSLALNEALCMGKICLVNSNFDSGMIDQIDDTSAVLFNFEKQSIAQFIINNKNTNWSSMASNAHKKANDIKVHINKLHNYLSTIFNKKKVFFIL